ncbi:MAG: helix-turn-helix transcriptional regulator [Ferrovibrio sp.]
MNIHKWTENDRLDGEVARDTLERFPYGVFLLDAQGEVLFVNTMARSALVDKGILRLKNGAIGAVHHATQRKLQAAIASSLSSSVHANLTTREVLTIPPKAGGPSYLVEVVPLLPRQQLLTDQQPVSLILVGERGKVPHLREHQVKEMYHLTNSEAEIAVMLAQGLRPAEICKIKGISINTLKTHRRRLFDKLGVETQAQLARLIYLG